MNTLAWVILLSSSTYSPTAVPISTREACINAGQTWLISINGNGRALCLYPGDGTMFEIKSGSQPPRMRGEA